MSPTRSAQESPATVATEIAPLLATVLPAPLPVPASSADMPTEEEPRRVAPKMPMSPTKTLTTLLAPFTITDVPILARTDPTVAQKEQQPMTLGRVWEYLPFLASQGTALTKAFVKHHMWGPPKPSWGVELTLFTAFLRESAAYSHLSSLARLRAVLDLSTFLPTPKDGIVTPISFRVKKRGLRGFLAEADAEEDGKRLITGEWVINKRLWKRMQQTEVKTGAGGKDKVVLYLHGGAYYIMSAETHRFLTISVSRYTESRVFAINYRLAPETRFPGQLHDAVSAYMRLTIDLKIPPENIIFAGDSAGGGLVLATLMYLRDEGYPLPSGAILMSPWVDLTMSCESWTTNAPYDYLPQPKTDDHLHPVKCLLGEVNIHVYLTHPYVSPLFGNFDSLPPLLIQAGDAEVLRDEITLLAHKASLAGVKVEHEIFEDCVHVFQAFLFLEASRKAFCSQRTFVKHTLPGMCAAKEVDKTEMDMEIKADAHAVDEKGNAEPTSLPSSPTPRNSALPADVDEEDEDDDFTTPLPPIPTPPFSYDHTGLIPPSAASDTSGESSNGPSSAAISASSSGSSFLPPRPILRAYASARDLLMTKSPSLSLSPRSNHKRSQTSSHWLELSDKTHSPGARSSSHPDLRGLLREYEEHGAANATKLFEA